MKSGKTGVFEFDIVIPGTTPGSFMAKMIDRGYKEAAPKSFPILVGADVVGSVSGVIFTKRVHSSRHFLRKPPAIALDVSSLTQAKSHGAITVEIIDLDTNRKYYAGIAKIEDEGVRFNRGHGDQIFLPLEEWHNQNREQKEMKLTGAAA